MSSPSTETKAAAVLAEAWRDHRAPRTDGGFIHVIQSLPYLQTEFTISSGLTLGNSERPEAMCAATAALVVRLFNLHQAGRRHTEDQAAAITARGDLPPDSSYALTENEVTAAQMMNGMLVENEALRALLLDAVACFEGLGRLAKARDMAANFQLNALADTAETKAETITTALAKAGG